MCLTKIDPATDPTIQQFLDLFCIDPVLRLEVEGMLSEEARVNPYSSSGSELEALSTFSEAYLSVKHEDARKVIAYGANAGILGMLENWRKRKEAR